MCFLLSYPSVFLLQVYINLSCLYHLFFIFIFIFLFKFVLTHICKQYMATGFEFYFKNITGLLQLWSNKLLADWTSHK